MKQSFVFALLLAGCVAAGAQDASLASDAGSDGVTHNMTQYLEKPVSTLVVDSGCNTMLYWTPERSFVSVSTKGQREADMSTPSQYEICRMKGNTLVMENNFTDTSDGGRYVARPNLYLSGPVDRIVVRKGGSLNVLCDLVMLHPKEVLVERGGRLWCNAGYTARNTSLTVQPEGVFACNGLMRGVNVTLNLMDSCEFYLDHVELRYVELHDCDYRLGSIFPKFDEVWVADTTTMADGSMEIHTRAVPVSQARGKRQFVHLNNLDKGKYVWRESQPAQDGDGDSDVDVFAATPNNELVPEARVVNYRQHGNLYENSQIIDETFHHIVVDCPNTVTLETTDSASSVTMRSPSWQYMHERVCTLRGDTLRIIGSTDREAWITVRYNRFRPIYIDIRDNSTVVMDSMRFDNRHGQAINVGRNASLTVKGDYNTAALHLTAQPQSLVFMEGEVNMIRGALNLMDSSHFVFCGDGCGPHPWKVYEGKGRTGTDFGSLRVNRSDSPIPVDTLLIANRKGWVREMGVYYNLGFTLGNKKGGSPYDLNPGFWMETTLQTRFYVAKRSTLMTGLGWRYDLTGLSNQVDLADGQLVWSQQPTAMKPINRLRNNWIVAPVTVYVAFRGSEDGSGYGYGIVPGFNLGSLLRHRDQKGGDVTKSDIDFMNPWRLDLTMKVFLGDKFKGKFGLPAVRYNLLPTYVPGTGKKVHLWSLSLSM